MQVYLSYMNSDLPLAQKIAKGLQRAGFDVWYEDLYVFPGDNRGTLIGEALDHSDGMVVLLTPESLQFKQVTGEAQFALGNLRYARRVVPVIVGIAPAEAHTEIPWILRYLPMVYLSENDFDQGIEKIVQALTYGSDLKFPTRVGEI